MTASGTTAVRRQLGRRLRSLREAAGKTAADVAQAGLASKAKLSRIENGWATVKMADVRTLCWLYGADHLTTDTLSRMAGGTASPGWWEEPPESPDAADRLYPGLEAAADRLYCYEPELVPGLLCTPDYLRAVTASWPSALADRADRQAAELAHRIRAGFERDQPLVVRAVLDAAVLSRSVGGPDVMTSQVRKLVQQGRSPHVEVRVLPWAAGAHPAMRGGFTVLEFDSPDDPSVACVETLAGTRYVEEPDTLVLYRQVFGMVHTRSVPLEQYLAGSATAIDLRAGQQPGQQPGQQNGQPRGQLNGTTGGTGHPEVVSRPGALPRR